MIEIPVSKGSEGWNLTAHACRHCGGRVIQSGVHFICATCESQCAHNPRGICGCGMFPSARPKGRASGLFTCIANPTRGPSSPAAIVVRYGA
jgi:hypothetical protein